MLLAFYGLALTLLFLLLWRFGVLDELANRGRPGEPEEDATLHPAMQDRLEVFKQFLEDMGDKDEDS